MRKNARLARKLWAIALFMTGFSVILWWSADMLCDWAGIGLNPNSGPRTEIKMAIPAVRFVDEADEKGSVATGVQGPINTTMRISRDQGFPLCAF